MRDGVNLIHHPAPFGEKSMNTACDEKKICFAGVDIGSTTSKAVLVDKDGEILGSAIVDTSWDRNGSGQQALDLALEKAGRTRVDVAMIYTTGYGRRNFEGTDKAIPEIVCHGAGTVKLYPGVRTIIDIGGQDAKIISVNERGQVSRFEMNDKCAAGTGRFFEVLSHRLLGVPIDALGPLAMESTDPCLISATCTVFAETEIVSYLTQGRSQSDVAMGILESTARRIFAMGAQSQNSFAEPIVVSGGPAKNIALKRALEAKIGKPVILAEQPQIEAALGAALMAKYEYNNQ